MAGEKVAGGNSERRTRNWKCCWRNLREKKRNSQRVIYFFYRCTVHYGIYILFTHQQRHFY